MPSAAGPEPSSSPRVSGPGPASPHRSLKVAEQVARRIVHEIATGRFGVGATLPAEQQMIERYGVGRGSLREALRILEVQGILRMKPGPGGGPVVVADPTGFARMATLHLQLAGATLRDLLHARQLLEPMMAWHAATHRVPATVEALRQSVRLADASSGTPDPDYMASSGEFHRVLNSASANPGLNLMAQAFVDLYVSRIGGMHFPATEREHVRQAHAAIVDAIADGRPEDARALTDAHMAQLGRLAEQRFSGLLDELMDWQ